MQAIEFLEETLDIQESLHDRSKREIALTNLGYLYEQIGRNDQAISRYQKVVDLLESIQSDIRIEEFKAAFLANNLDAYLRTINVLWDEGRFEEAFHYVERARARPFLDHLANSTIDLHTGTDADLLERESALRKEIEA